jgi:predicted dienelactone hydrolase
MPAGGKGFNGARRPGGAIDSAMVDCLMALGLRRGGRHGAGDAAGRGLASALAALVLAAAAGLAGAAPPAALGFLQLPQADGGSTTVFYPTAAAEQPVQRGPFTLSWAADAPPLRGNGRLVLISHGSGGSPWVHVDLARVLVQRGFVVALPQHRGDNHLDSSSPGPASWDQRPAEVGRSIDLLAGHPALSAQLALDAVGVFGGSAGGHTALALAGGQWSPARFRDHCRQHIEDDFASCVGFATRLNGGWLDRAKLWLARRIIDWRFNDETLRSQADPRVAAAVAMVPFAADFVPASLATPRVPLGLVIAGLDVSQVPRFHGLAVRAACAPRCELIMDLPGAGHGAMLSPLPPLEPGSIAAALLSDPPGFDRERALPELHGRIADFFARTLPAVPQ